MAEFIIKRNARLPHIQAAVRDAMTGQPVNFSRITSVQFIMTNLKGVIKVNGAADVFDAENGVVEYRWAPGDTDTAGEYEAEFKLMWDTGEVMRVPTDGYIIVRVVPDKG